MKLRKPVIPVLVAAAAISMPAMPALAVESAQPDTAAVQVASTGQRDPLASTNGRRVIPGISLMSLPDSGYGPYWGTVDGAPAFFMSDGTLFAQQAKGVIDVSEWQGEIDWQKVKDAGVDGAIIRISYGWNNGFDKYALRNISECKRLGIPFGIYMYSYAYDAETGGYEGADVVSLLQQAGVSPDDLSYPVYYDLERWDDWGGHSVPTDPNVYRQIVDAWYAKLQAAGYENLGVYSYTSYLNTSLNDPSIRSRASWVATYGPRLEFDITTPQRGWQYTSSGRIDGISGNVDMSAFGVKGPVYSADDLKGMTVDVEGTPLTDFDPVVNDYMLDQESGTVAVGNIPSGWTYSATQNKHIGGVMLKVTSPDGLYSAYYKFSFAKQVADGDKVDAYLTWAKELADDQTIGYSMSHRQLDPDVDCSSFVYYALKYGARFDMPVDRAFVTGTMEDALTKLGFTKHEYTGEDDLKPGDILLDPAKDGHTEIYTGNGKSIGAHSDRGNAAAGDQDGTEVNEASMWTGAKEYWRYEAKSAEPEYGIDDLKGLAVTVDGKKLDSFDYRTTSYQVDGHSPTIQFQNVPDGWTTQKHETVDDQGNPCVGYEFGSPDGKLSVEYVFHYEAAPTYSMDDLNGLAVKINGEPLQGFDYRTFRYSVDATSAKLEMTGIPGGWSADKKEDSEAHSVTVTLSSPDGTVTATYVFSYAAAPTYSTDDLKGMTVKVNGERLESFDYRETSYDLDVPAPTVEVDGLPDGWTSKSDDDTDERVVSVTVSSPDGTVNVTYRFSYAEDPDDGDDGTGEDVTPGEDGESGGEDKPDTGTDGDSGTDANPGTGEPDEGDPGTGDDSNEPGTDTPDTDNPEPDAPDADQSDTDQPDVDNPEPDQPDTDKPDTDDTGEDKPDTETPNHGTNPDTDGDQPDSDTGADEDKPDDETDADEPDAGTGDTPAAPGTAAQDDPSDDTGDADTKGQTDVDDLPQTGAASPAASLGGIGLFALLGGLLEAFGRRRTDR